MTQINTISIPKARSKATLYWIVGICIAPTIAAFATFYWVDWQPNTETTNYGELLTGQSVVAEMPSAKTLDGKPFSIKQLEKKWVFASVDRGVCDEPCAKRLFTSRQLKAITGRERDRVVRLWLVTDDAPIKPELLTAHPDLVVVRVKQADVAVLSVKAGQLQNQHTWIIDPLGRPMMRYEASPDPDRMKKDLTKLLYASKSWQN
jgi:hypothetical protein